MLQQVTLDVLVITALAGVWGVRSGNPFSWSGERDIVRSSAATISC